MSRSSEDILADKILSETGIGPEKYEAQQRLMQDYEDYAQSRARIHALEKKYKEQEEKQEREKSGLTADAYKFYKVLNGFGYALMPIALFCIIIGIFISASSANNNLFLAGMVLLGVSWLMDKVSRQKLKR